MKTGEEIYIAKRYNASPVEENNNLNSAHNTLIPKFISDDFGFIVIIRPKHFGVYVIFNLKHFGVYAKITIFML